jgi:putative NIF3 family GTP cyclohydrolase 1 type 2
MGEILNAITEIPEYKNYARRGNPPIIVNGSRGARVGKLVATEFTGGTNGPEEFFEAKAKAGVGTVLTMHVTEKSLEEAKKNHVNIIQCSHIASDALGINLMLDEMVKLDSKMKFIEASGFIRVERKKW